MDSLNEIWTRIEQLWAARAPREQRMLLAAAGAALRTMLYLGVWDPAVHERTQALEAVQQARDTGQRIEELAALRPGSGTGRTPADRSRSLLAVVDRAARSGTLGKAPERLQPEGEDSVRVWLEVVAADLERKDAGVASARLQVERGA